MTDPLSPPLASPSLYEMAALTSELDTAVITSKVKEILLQHNVGQKVRNFSCKCWHGEPKFTNVMLEHTDFDQVLKLLHNKHFLD